VSAQWCDEVAALGLLDERVVQYTKADGTPGQLNGFKVINEDRLKALDVGVIERWTRQGLMGVATAHMLSLGHVRKLARLLAAGQAKASNTTQDEQATQMPAQAAALAGE
jgi:putative transposase